MKTVFRSMVAVLMALVAVGFAFGADVIKIGGSGPLSGAAASYGISVKNAAMMAVEEWNAKGGVLGKKIEFITEDDKADPAEAAAVFNKLLQQDRVVAIVGPVTSGAALAGAPLAQSARVPLIVPTATNEKVTQVGDFIYRACYIDPFQAKAGAAFAYKELKLKAASIIFDTGNDYTKGMADAFKQHFISLGGKVLANEGYASGVTDFKVQLTKIIQGKPELIYIPNYYNDVGLIAKQARELGFKGPLIGGDGWDSEDLVKIAGAAVDGCYFTNHYSKDAKAPAVQNFVKNYKAKYNSTPDGLASLGYDAMNIMLDAIKRAGSTDPAKIQAALKATNLACVGGQIKFDANRNPIKAVTIIEIQKGAQVYKSTVTP